MAPPISNPDSFEAMSGYDLKAIFPNHVIMIGNRMLIQDSNVSVTKSVDEILSALKKIG